MKTKCYFLILFVGIFFNTDVFSTHYMGGEITWECLPNGRYRFTLKVYRECYNSWGNACQFGATQAIYASGGGVSTINMTRLVGYPIDISPQCNSDSAFPRIFCPGMSNGAPNIGAMQLHVYTSDAAFPTGVLLTGVPPPVTGWTFAWGSSLTNGICCRNPATNASSASSYSWYLQAKMYNYNNNNVYPCFDSSPQFAEIPSPVFCSAYPFQFAHFAFDSEKDSLNYEWGCPMVNSTTPFNQYDQGYSYNSPLPGITHNPNNVPATIDPNTGVISFTSYTNGAFLTNVKVTAWKCGVKVAEVWREFQMVLSSCTGNNPPLVPAPFVNPVNGLYELFETTVYAGDFVNFNLAGTDFEFLPNMQPQSVTLDAFGLQLGENFTSTIAGCLHPPCATLTPPPPRSAPFAVQSTFSWQTTCAHVASNNSCGTTNNVYDFFIKANDDFCPVPAQRLQKIRITVVDRPPLPPPRISCLKVLQGGDVELSWTPVSDTMGVFKSYLLYTSSNPNGPFSLVDSIFINTGNVISYIHHGANAEASAVYYYVQTLSGCRGDLQSICSDTVSTMHLTVTSQGANSELAVLNWNSVTASPLPSSGGVYYIYREHPAGIWTLIDSTTALTYVDSLVFCNQFINYRVEIRDTAGCDTNNVLILCYSRSNADGASFSDDIPPDIPVLQSLSVFQINQGAHLNWSRTNADDTEAYVVYREHPGSFVPIDTVFGIDSTHYIDLYNNPCHGFPAYAVAAVDSCGNVSAMGNSIEIYKMQAVYYDIDDVIRLSWQAPAGQLPVVYEYTLYRSVNYGNWNVYLYVSPPGAGHNQYFPDNNSVYCYYLSARNQDFSVVVNSCPKCVTKGVYAGEQSFNETGGIRVFPNPAGDYLSVSGLTQLSQVYIYDYSGKLLFKKEIQESNLDISSLSSGFYIMRIVSSDASYFFSFVKQ